MKLLKNIKEPLKIELTRRVGQITRLEKRQIELCSSDISLLNRATKALSKSNNLDPIAKTALSTILEAGDLEFGALYLFHNDTGELALSFCTGVSDELKEELGRMPVADNIVCKATEGVCVTASQDLFGDVSAVNHEGQLLEIETMRSFVTVPLSSRGRIIGVIIGSTQSLRELSIREINLLETLGCQIGVAIDNAQLLEKLIRLSVIDELTGLYNRRHLDEVLEAEIYRSQRSERPFCLVMFDLDKFKDYNDKLGHTSGDLVLQAFARILKLELRKMDSAFRYGGDEFCVVLPATDVQRAEKIAERIRSMFTELPEVHCASLELPLGLSAGIAQFPQAAVTAQWLVFMADSALYHAKRDGRNRSVMISDLSTVASRQNNGALEQIYALANYLETREPSTRGHAKNTAIISQLIGKAIGLSAKELSDLRAAAFLHDIGKLEISGSILTKADKLTREEWEVMKNHSVEGARIIAREMEFTKLVPIVRCHHERYDGTGYPSGLSGKKIPLKARIISIADGYETMTHNRPYSQAIASEDALDEIRKCSGTQFDPLLVDVLTGTVNIPALA